MRGLTAEGEPRGRPVAGSPTHNVKHSACEPTCLMRPAGAKLDLSRRWEASWCRQFDVAPALDCRRLSPVTLSCAAEGA